MTDIFKHAEHQSLLHLADVAERSARAIGRRLEYIRQMELMTKAELSAAMGISEDALASYEAGTVVASREVVNKFLQALPKK